MGYKSSKLSWSIITLRYSVKILRSSSIGAKIFVAFVLITIFASVLGFFIGYLAGLEEELDRTQSRLEHSPQEHHSKIYDSYGDAPNITLPRVQPEEFKSSNENETISSGDLENSQFLNTAIESLQNQTPKWITNAAYSVTTNGKPKIALVIDDIGIDLKRSKQIIALKGPLTIAILTYSSQASELARTARLNGHELIVHMPMEPLNPMTDAGFNVLKTSLDSTELMRRIDWGLTRFNDYVGVNNHMGSLFTSWDEGMSLVLTEVKRRGLLYLDSRTTASTVTKKIAHKLKILQLERDVFLDNDPTPEGLNIQFSQLERIAKNRGYAIGIGHPYDVTINALNKWLFTAASRGFSLVPVSAIAKLLMSE